MTDNNIQIPPVLGNIPNYYEDAAYRAYLNEDAAPLPPG